jgi:hypothetical protein
MGTYATLTLLTSLLVLACLTAGTARGNHLPSTPKLDRLSHYRGTLNTTRANKCLPRFPYRWTLRQVPVHMRSYVVAQTKTWIFDARDASARCVPWYVTRQMWAGGILGRESAGDPWPNCPDPYDGSGSSWTDTVACENGGSWLDSPGFYRCGLQFHPSWEIRFGRLCP